MDIRKTTEADLEEVMSIYADARRFMEESGNHRQWPEDYPYEFIIREDIDKGLSHVCVLDGEILAVFYFDLGPDNTYDKIDGSWLDSKPYGVVHRIARKNTEKAKGAGAFCLGWCYEKTKNIRIDTHRDNLPMRRLLEKLGYTYCGTIWIETGAERYAYHKI